MALPDKLTMEGLAGWHERFGQDELLLARFFPEIANTASGNTVSWQRWDFSRDVAEVVPYNAKGQNVDLRVRTKKTAPAPTLREKKEIPGSHMQWLSSPSDPTRAMGQQEVDGELKDLVNRVYRRHELWRSQIFTGTLTFTQAGHTITVAIGIPAAQLDATVAASWATAATDIITDLRVAKAAVEASAGVSPDTLLCSPEVIGYLLNNTAICNLLSDDAKDELRSAGIARIPGIDLDVIEYGGGYVPSATKTFTRFVAAHSCVLFPSDPAKSGFGLIKCSSPDKRAGEAHRGLFMAPWEDVEPPAGVWVHAEYTGLPICRHPESIYRFIDTTATGA